MSGKYLSKLMKGQAEFSRDCPCLEGVFSDRYTVDVALGYIELAAGETFPVEQSGWGSFYQLLDGAVDISLKNNRRSWTIADCGCVAVPNGSAHKVRSRKTSRLFWIRVSNSSYLLPGILPPVISMTRKDMEAADGLLPMINQLKALEPQNGPIRHLMKCRIVDVISMILLTEVMQNLDAPLEELMEEGFDRRIKAAISAIHRDPKAPWTVESLAREVSLSRSSFAKRFRDVVGESPMQYVARIRINLASSYLQSLDWSVSNIAEEVGYQSEGAFINAFKRQMNVSPGKFRRNARVHDTH